jgi:hypothetical protein
VKLHELLFDLTHFGQFEYDSVYSMPIQYRTFYMRKLINVKEKEQAEMDKAQGKMSTTPASKVVKGPQIEGKR